MGQSLTKNHPATRELDVVKVIANLMDSKFTIPGTRIKFGLDPILGLIPGFGLLTTTVISLFLLFIIGRHGTSGKVLLLMLLNILLDAIITSIPIVGTIGDIFYKANNRNIKLLYNYYEFNKHNSSGLALLILLLTSLIATISLIGYGTYKIIESLVNLIPF